MTVSTDTTGYLQQEVLRNARYLVLTVDKHGLVARQECPGIQWRIEGVTTGRKLPDDLQGIIESTNGQIAPQLIPYVNLQGNLIADVHVLNRGDDRQIILQDVSGPHDDKRKLQQKAHEVTLLLEHQAELNLQLEHNKREAERASQAKSEFIASMSHEFKSPISSILIHADRLRARAPEAREPTAIQGAAWYLLTLVDNLLTQARSGEEELHLHQAVVDVHSLLEDLTELFSNQAQERGLQFQVSYSGAPRFLVTDELRLKQVLINLLSNAIRYTNQGHVSLVCECAANQTRFRVEDSGIGIAQPDLEAIFKPFERLNPGASSGAGLGLAISRSLVEAMGGEIQVQSEPGKGSTFSFALDNGNLAGSNSGKSLSGVTVLLVEDDEDLMETYRVLLEDWGMEVFTSSSFLAAVEMFRSRSIHLVVADQYLGDGNGRDLLDRFRAENPAIRTILCSGAEPSFPGDSSIDLLLNKPVSAERLYAALLHVV